MADVDIVVDSGDLKAAIDLLNIYGISFTKMVNQVHRQKEIGYQERLKLQLHKLNRLGKCPKGS